MTIDSEELKNLVTDSKRETESVFPRAIWLSSRPYKHVLKKKKKEPARHKELRSQRPNVCSVSQPIICALALI